MNYCSVFVRVPRILYNSVELHYAFHPDFGRSRFINAHLHYLKQKGGRNEETKKENRKYIHYRLQHSSLHYHYFIFFFLKVTRISKKAALIFPTSLIMLKLKID